MTDISEVKVVVKGTRDAFIALAEKSTHTARKYEIELGGNSNNNCYIRY